MDLGSANGTYLNGKKIEPKRYYELFEKDVLKFGYSSREYVLLHEHSADAEEDDNMVEDIKTEEIKTEAEDEWIICQLVISSVFPASTILWCCDWKMFWS